MTALSRRGFVAAAVGGLWATLGAAAQSAQPARPLPLPAWPAWPTKMWISAFHSHTEQYLPAGVTGRVTGNAITLTGSATDPQAIVRELRRTRQDHPATPVICTPSPAADQPEFLGRIVAWWVGGADEADLASNVVAAQGYTPRAIWAYLDRRGWPATRPWWMTDQALPALQCYRAPGESFAQFDAAIRQDLDAVATYGRPCVLTLAFYDRLGGHAGMVEQIAAVQQLVHAWVMDYPVVGLHLFSDRRPGGMLDYGLYPLADLMDRANPARPNRFDYWQHGDLAAVFRNKLGQSTPLVVLSDLEKTALRQAVGV